MTSLPQRLRNPQKGHSGRLETWDYTINLRFIVTSERKKKAAAIPMIRASGKSRPIFISPSNNALVMWTTGVSGAIQLRL